MKKLNLFLIITSLTTLIAGMIIYALIKEILIIRRPSGDTITQEVTTPVTKKNVKLSLWHNEKWNSESTEILWPPDQEQKLNHLLCAWLTLVEEEGLVEKKISVQTVMISDSLQEAFVSFDRNPLVKEQSTFQKLMWIEGILKSIRENGIVLRKIRFLEHHQELQDPHLDFSNSWPLGGFETIS